MDKKKVLEMFVENDSALSLLLDFISTRHLDGQGFSSNKFGETSLEGTSKLQTMQSNAIHSPSIYNVQPSGQMSQSLGGI